MDRAPAAVAYQLPRVAGSMACSAPLQNAATREAYTGPLGQHCDRCVHQPPRRSTLPSHVATRPPSPPLESEASEVASRRSCPRRAQSCSRRALTSARPSGRMATPPRGPADWRRFGDAQVDLFASPDTSHCQLFFSLSEGTLGTDALACSWPRGLRKYAFPPVSLLAQTLCKVREDEEQVLLVAPYWPNRTWFQNWCSSRQPLLGKFLWGGIYFLREGAPSGTRAQTCGISTYGPWTGRGGSKWATSSGSKHYHFCQGLSTRQAYRLKWNLFVDWCSPRREDPRRCPIAVVLSFLQDGLERRLSPSTLKVYVAAIAAHHDAVDGKSLGKHDLVIRFLRGARRLNPPRPHLVPSWDLPSVLSALRGAPFEPLQSVELKFLSLKTVLLSALATVKRVGDLQAFSVDDSCLEFGPADSHVVLRPRPGYVPKVPTMPFRDQVVNLQALPREEADPAIALLCPVRALRIYVDRTQSFRTSDQIIFVCFGGQQKGRAVSKQRLAHWIVEAIVLAYQARRLPCPLGWEHTLREALLPLGLWHEAPQ